MSPYTAWEILGAYEAILIAFNRTRDRIVAREVALADTAASRAQGLLGRDRMEAEEGLWIVPCPMIHTFFMRFPIDVLFLDRNLRVRRVIEDLKPWRLSPWVFTAHSVLELPAGALDGSVSEGDLLEIR
ncbi:MAG: hypothetical protein COR54_11300 [Elusimicrobia bacterium CG22_combo_CG10-13_8_21_14_all_63_91]|nr:MAG: hypothetical protein COR54_11300 [Elusimicrobia bacterium CG22_combo_CG10-13_8_21_14_all_63_91]